jgi:cobalt/nickel transport system ATP-binding protein
LIQLNKVSYRYEEKPALEPVDLQIAQGEHLVLLGNNGSGKSTLLRILAGLYFPKGTYRFDGMDMTKKSIDAAFRRRVGIVFQNPESMLFNPTVYDEIAFSLHEFGIDNVREHVERIAETFGLQSLLETNPLQLSGGEKQKVMLAAILVYEPDLLLLDEPTAAMDPRTTGWFIDTVLDLDTTVVVATHDLHLAYEISERAVVLNEEHRMIFDGNIDELFGDEALLIEANLIHKHRHKHKSLAHSHYHVHL